ncbi:MAG: tetratricopeptide repeat protein [Treponema sp.]|jgi:tetratricopeptide (TPR) repeat protein|nr:tetratricopeptide repeat protein [Treponema sp.]
MGKTTSNAEGSKLRFSAFVIPLLLIFSACSSAPKRPAEIFSIRSMAESQMDLANKEADRGNYSLALDMLAEARRLAVSADDPSLRIRTALSQGNALFALDRVDEAEACWNTSLAEAERIKSRELAAVCRIHLARGTLLAEGGAETARSVRDTVTREMGSVGKDKLDTAFSWVVIGLAEKELGRPGEAEAAVKKSLAIHEKALYLEQAAYDWYLIASIRSQAGKYADAQAALESALILDRRSENSYGLATDWRALGDVYKKAGAAADAEIAWRRSAEIFRSLGQTEAAEDAGSRF